MELHQYIAFYEVIKGIHELTMEDPGGPSSMSASIYYVVLA